MTIEEKGIIPMGPGTCYWVQLGAVVCKQYKGKFVTAALQAKAHTGKWYSMIEGNPYAIEGEGDTPQEAIADSIYRTANLMEKYNKSITQMQNVLGE